MRTIELKALEKFVKAEGDVYVKKAESFDFFC